MMVRKIIFILLAAVAAGLLAGVRARHAEEIPRGRLVLEYWEKWTGHEAEQMKEIVDDFNRTVGAEKGIWVRYLSMTAVDQKTLIATAAGVPPDIAGVFDGQVVQYAEANAIMPLDGLAREHGIGPDYYKKVYWDACMYQGHLWALVSTPASVGLLYNKRIFQENRDALRAAGCDADRPPRTIEELDRYAAVLDQWSAGPGGERKLIRAGHIPLETDWYIQFIWLWFGGTIWNPQTRQINLLDENVVRAYEWMQSYGKRLGPRAIADFRSGIGNFKSLQNGFLSGSVVMEMQGPWMAAYIHDLKPSMDQWKFSSEVEAKLPFQQRKQNHEWGAAFFPSAVPGVEDIGYIGFDCLVIPRGSRHPREAFEFIAFVNRQQEMEKLCSLHCKNSPLAQVSESFIDHHPNPYVDVFEAIARSPHAYSNVQCPIMPQIESELRQVAVNVTMLQAAPRQALAEAHERISRIWQTYERHRLQRQGGTAP